MKNQQKALQERVKRLLFLNQYKDLKATQLTIHVVYSFCSTLLFVICCS